MIVPRFSVTVSYNGEPLKLKIVPQESKSSNKQFKVYTEHFLMTFFVEWDKDKDLRIISAIMMPDDWGQNNILQQLKEKLIELKKVD